MLYNLLELTRDISEDPFQYLLCAAWKSTCWDNEDHYQQMKQEIIEIQVFLVDTCSGKVLATFRQYVRPKECPKLTDFCVESTKITQEMVESGLSLAESIKQFTTWLKEMITKHNLVLPKTTPGDLLGNTAFCSWGTWHCAQMQRECRRKEIPEAPFFDQWIDVKRFYQTHYEKEETRDLLKAMEHLRLKTGNCDARNLATLVTKMRQDSAVFRITLDQVPHLKLNVNFL